MGQSAAAVASLPAASACLWRSTVDRRQGGRSGTHAVLAKEEERGRKKGAGNVSGAPLKGSGEKQRKEGVQG
jgi:hypothetical protein